MNLPISSARSLHPSRSYRLAYARANYDRAREAEAEALRDLESARNSRSLRNPAGFLYRAAHEILKAADRAHAVAVANRRRAREILNDEISG
jgi:hypothetical protein